MGVTKKILLGLVASISFGANAQTFTMSNTTSNLNTLNHLVTVTYTAGATPANSASLSIVYNTAHLTFSAGTVDNNGTVAGSCSAAVAGTVLCTVDAGDDGTNLLPIPTGYTISFEFDTLSTVVNSPLDLTVVALADLSANGITGTAVDGTVNIVAGPQASYNSATPAPGGSITFSDVVGGGASNAPIMTVSNDGLAGAPTLTVTPSITGLAGPGTITVSAAPAPIAQGGSANLTISCDATGAGAITATLDIVHNGDGNPASPQTYPVTCTGSVTNTPGNLASGATTQPTGQTTAGTTATGSQAFTVESAGAATANTVLACSITGASNAANAWAVTTGNNQTLAAPIASVSNVGFTCVAQGATGTAQLGCTATGNPGNVVESFGPFDLTCPAGTTAPNPAANPASGSTIALFGAVAAQTTATNVNFTNVGTAPATTAYQVTGCTLTGTGYALSPAPTFPLNVNPGATVAVGVACTPATVGPNAPGTLTCNTSTAFTPTYNLSCTGAVLGPIPTLNDMSKFLLVALTLGLGLLGFAFRRSA